MNVRLIFIICFSILSNRVYSLELNDAFIKTTTSDDNLKNLSDNINNYGKPKLGTGYYNVNINKTKIGETLVSFIRSDINNNIIIDFNSSFVDELASKGIFFDEDKFNFSKKTGEFGDVKNISYKLEAWSNTLYINIPDKYLTPRSLNRYNLNKTKGSDSGAFLGYDLNIKTDINDLDSNVSYGNFRLGINLGGFALRSNLSSQLNENGVELNDIVLYKSLLDIKSTLSAGKLMTNSEYRDSSVGYYGFSLSTDMKMYDNNDSGYNHIIRGDVSEPSIINVYLNDKLIYTKQVGMGQYYIQDIPSIGNGELVIEEVGDSGKKHIRKEYVSSLSSLYNTGISTYDISLGKTDGSNEFLFLALSYKKGFDSFTISGSQIISEDYWSAYVKSIFPLGYLGALEVDTAYSNTEINNSWEPGARIGALYSNSIFNIIDLQLSGYRFSTENYKEFKDVVDSNYSEDDYFDSFKKIKSQYITRLGVNSSFGTWYLSFMKNDFWNSDDTEKDLSLSYSNYFDFINFSVNLSRNEMYNYKDDRINIVLSMPLGYGEGYLSSSYNKSYDTESFGLRYNDRINDSISYDLASNVINDELSYNAGVSVDNNNAKIRANISSNSEYTNLSIGASGTILYLDHDIDFTDNKGDNFIKVKTNSDSASIRNNKPNSNKNIIISNLVPFRYNMLKFNEKSLTKNEYLDLEEINLYPDNHSLYSIDAKINKVVFKKITFINNKKTYKIGTKVKLNGREYLLDDLGSTLVMLDEKSKEISYEVNECSGTYQGSNKIKEVINVTCS
ncbi:TPA: fimbria/pilus outer membrane usher protein [Photobacterium damselae]